MKTKKTSLIYLITFIITSLLVFPTLSSCGESSSSSTNTSTTESTTSAAKVYVR